MKKLIILGKGASKQSIVPMGLLNHIEDIPGYDGEDVWTVATHPVDNAHGYIALHGEKVPFGRSIKIDKFILEELQFSNILINNSISVMLAMASLGCGYEKIRIVGCPLEVGSEYTEQRESLFQVMGYCRRFSDIVWDDDIQSYSNYYSDVLGINYK